MPVLIFSLNDDIQVVELPNGVPVFLGRARENDICVTSPKISRRHAVFLNEGGICGVKDLRSVNGVRVNGERIERPTILRDDDSIGIAKYRIKFKQSLAVAEDVPAPPASPAGEKPKSVPSRDSTRLRLPRAMSVTGRLDSLEVEDVPVEAARDGDDTRLYVREKRTTARTPATDGDKSTKLVVKKNLSEKYNDEYIARSLGLIDAPTEENDAGADLEATASFDRVPDGK